MSATYDFQNLSFDDFERLTGDLLQRSLGVPFESFRTGRDGGIDLRYAPSESDSIIVQCKRYAPEGFQKLLADLKNVELPKIIKLNPTRYIISTSCKLNPDQKAKILGALKPYCKSTTDILGQNELNSLIRNNREVEKQHFKLWMGSTNVLKQVLHAGIFNFSRHETTKLKNEISKYVVHNGFTRALELLDKAHHCIIVGIPGIGKTTAARLILAHYLHEGFNVVSVSGDIGEAWKVLESEPLEEKTIIYYDDFLGQMTFSQKLNKNEDRRLLDLMEHCETNKNKRFVLTTRDYIFDQALGAYEPLGRAADDLRRSSILLDDYDRHVRARLLINHMLFSNIPSRIHRELVSTRSYDKIIDHRNFLPRVVEKIFSEPLADTASATVFLEHAIAKLDDPALIWKSPLQQLSAEARCLVQTLVSLDGEHDYVGLEEAWRAVANTCNIPVHRQYKEVLRETDGSFTTSQTYVSLSKNPKRSGIIIKFMNPSAREFVLADTLERAELCEAIFRSAHSFKQLFFWNEVRREDTRDGISNLIEKNLELIIDRGLSLLDKAEPKVIFWAGEPRIKWNPPKKIIDNLHRLFDILGKYERPDLQHQITAHLLNCGVDFLSYIEASDDLLWLPEVIDAVLNSATGDASEIERIEELLTVDIQEWDKKADDFSSLRYAWDAVGRVALQGRNRDLPRSLHERFVARARDLSAAIDKSMHSDEISTQIANLRPLIDELDISLSKELNDLQSMEEEARIGEEEKVRDEVEVRLAPTYSRAPRRNSNEEIDGLFIDFASQLPTD